MDTIKTSSLLPSKPDLTSCKHYSMVPKDKIKNLIWRKEVLTMCQNDKLARKQITAMCAEDILFYTNTFGWVYEPRSIDMQNRELPFITYDYQDEALIETNKGIIEGHDLFTDKSRDMGASWIYIDAIKWWWHFHELITVLMLSRNEDYVDKKGDPKALFWKLDYMISHDPKWLQPRLNRTKLHLENIDTGSTIEGESTTQRAGRGGRFTFILLDEFAACENGMQMLSATADATKCRIFNSTYEGSGNAFYVVSQWPDIKKIRFPWIAHPDKNKGLYRVHPDRSVEWIDKEWRLKNPDYEPVLVYGFYHGFHSPWYDKECMRRTESEIKEQLDMDAFGSTGVFFDNNIIQNHIKEVCCAPLRQGDMFFSVDNYTRKSMKFIDSPNGMLKIWCPTNAEGIPLKEMNLVFGADISSGTGASNSTLCGYDTKNGEKICEFVSSKLKPYEFAYMSLAIANWFNSVNEPLLCWEAPGPGMEYGSTILDSRYSNIWYKKKKEKEFTDIDSTIPGWWPNKESKKYLLGEYRRMLLTKEVKNKSARAVNECREFIYDPMGGVVHSKERMQQDSSGARDNHGDIVIADALASMVISEYNSLIKAPAINGGEEEPIEIPDNCIFARRERNRITRLNNESTMKGW